MASDGRSDLEIIKLLYGPDSSPSEVALASSILHSKNIWDSQVKHVMEDVEGSTGLREWSLLQQVIASCSEAVLSKHYKHWTNLLTQALKVNKDEAIHSCLCGGVSTLLERAHKSPIAMPDFTKQKLPVLLQAVLCFSLSTTSLQLPAIRTAATCHALFPMGQNQSRTALQKWAEAAVFDPHIPLSIEGARVMALLCRHSNQRWGSLVDSAIAMLEWTLEQLFSPSKKSPKGKSPQSSGEAVLQLPHPLPKAEPERTACLLQLVDQLSRALSTNLLLPPADHGHLPSVPVERILCAILHGLGRRPLPGHTMECRVLEAALPIVRVSLVNVLSVLLRTCHTHLLPYAPYVRSVLMDEINLAQIQQSSTLLASVYRASSLWVSVAKDHDPALVKTLLQSLLDLSEHASTRRLQLQTLCEVVEVLGPVLEDSSLIVAVQQLSFEKLTPQTSSEDVLFLLRLLVACVRGRGELCPPIGPVMQLLTDLSHHHSDKQVQSASACVLSQCSLLMHPSVPPLPTVSSPHAHYTTGTSTHTSLLSHQPRPLSQAALPRPLHFNGSSLLQNQPSPSSARRVNHSVSPVHSTEAAPVSVGMPSTVEISQDSVSHKRKRNDSGDEDNIDERPRKSATVLHNPAGQRNSSPGTATDGALESSSLENRIDILQKDTMSVGTQQGSTNDDHTHIATSTEMSSPVNDGDKLVKTGATEDQLEVGPLKKHQPSSPSSSCEDDITSGAELFVDESSDASGNDEDM